MDEVTSHGCNSSARAVSLTVFLFYMFIINYVLFLFMHK